MDRPEPVGPLAAGTRPAKGPVFYGWYLVGAIGFILTIVSGLSFYNLPVLLKGFVAERGFSVSAASGATASFFVASGVFGAVTGRIIDRFDVRFMMVGGTLLSAATLASVGRIATIEQLYLFHIVFGIAYGASGLIPNTTTIARWFRRRRSLALSIASTGLSLGGVVMAPLATYLIHRYGLGAAGHYLAVLLVLAVVPTTLLFVRPSPEGMGLLPDGAQATGGDQAHASGPDGVAYAQAIRHPFFIGLLLAYIFALGSQVGALSHLYRLASLRANDAVAAATISCMAAASITGRLTAGWLLLKVSARRFTLMIIAAQGASLAFLAFAASPTAVLIGAVLFGLNIGNVLMMQALLLAETFGTRDYGRIFSTCQMGTMIGVAGGPFLVGAIFQWRGDYQAAYLVAASASALGFLTLLVAALLERRFRLRAVAA